MYVSIEIPEFNYFTMDTTKNVLNMFVIYDLEIICDMIYFHSCIQTQTIPCQSSRNKYCTASNQLFATGRQYNKNNVRDDVKIVI